MLHNKYSNNYDDQYTDPPPYPNYDIQEHTLKTRTKEEKLKEFFRNYEISPCFQEDISCVKNYDINLICDDSGSMTEPSDYLSFKTGKMVTKTRWQELQETVELIV